MYYKFYRKVNTSRPRSQKVSHCCWYILNDMKTSPSVIFFDVYQTLLDVKIPPEKSDRMAGWGAFVKALEKYEIAVTADDFYQRYEKRKNSYLAGRKEHAHHNMQTLVTDILEKEFDYRQPPEEVSRLLYVFRKASRGWARLYPHVADTLSLLSKEYTLSVASYTQGSYTQHELRELGIERFFSYFVYSSDVGVLKKSPAFYEHALKITKSKAEECIMIGDNYATDVLIPQQIGIRSIWIKNPINASEHAVEDEPANMLALEHFNQLPEKIEQFS